MGQHAEVVGKWWPPCRQMCWLLGNFESASQQALRPHLAFSLQIWYRADHCHASKGSAVEMCLAFCDLCLYSDGLALKEQAAPLCD